MTIKNFITFFILGATLGPICDGFHSHQDILYYPEIWKFKMAWWVPFLFGSAVVAIAYSHTHLDLALYKKINVGSWPKTIFSVICFITLYFLSSQLTFSTLINCFILYTLSLLIWWLFNNTPFGLLIAILTSITGSLVEITLIQTGKFAYYPQYSDFFGIPYWLPALYLSASIGVGALGKKICQLEFND